MSRGVSLFTPNAFLPDAESWEMILGDHFFLRSMAVMYVCSGDLCGSKRRNPMLFIKEYTSSDLSCPTWMWIMLAKTGETMGSEIRVLLWCHISWKKLWQGYHHCVVTLGEKIQRKQLVFCAFIVSSLDFYISSAVLYCIVFVCMYNWLFSGWISNYPMVQGGPCRKQESKDIRCRFLILKKKKKKKRYIN